TSKSLRTYYLQAQAALSDTDTAVPEDREPVAALTKEHYAVSDRLDDDPIDFAFIDAVFDQPEHDPTMASFDQPDQDHQGPTLGCPSQVLSVKSLASQTHTPSVNPD